MSVTALIDRRGPSPFLGSMDTGVTHPRAATYPEGGGGGRGWGSFLLVPRWGGRGLIAADCGVCVAFGSGWSAAKAGGFWRVSPPPPR